MYFLQIKPNSDKYAEGILSETILKLLNSNNFNPQNDSISDMTELIEEHVIELSHDSPMNYINSFYIDANKLDIKLDSYNVLCLNKTGNNYHLLLIDRYLNDNTQLIKLSDDEKKAQFNLIGSSISQYYNNNIAIFGNVFLIHMDCFCYDNLNNLDKSLKINNIYNNYKFYNLFELIADVYFINIYVKELNKIMVYSRSIINNYLSTNKPVDVLKNIIKITYNNLTLFIKTSDHLVDSHSHIISMTNDSYYLSNILVSDIEEINLKIKN